MEKQASVLLEAEPKMRSGGNDLPLLNQTEKKVGLAMFDEAGFHIQKSINILLGREKTGNPTGPRRGKSNQTSHTNGFGLRKESWPSKDCRKASLPHNGTLPEESRFKTMTIRVETKTRLSGGTKRSTTTSHLESKRRGVRWEKEISFTLENGKGEGRFLEF